MGKVQVVGLARQLNINRALKSAIAQPWLLATLYHFVRSDAKKRTVAGWPRPNELADMTKALKHQRVNCQLCCPHDLKAQAPLKSPQGFERTSSSWRS